MACSHRQVIEESGNSDIATGCDEVDYQTQPAVNEEDDSSRQYGDQIKENRNSRLEKG